MQYINQDCLCHGLNSKWAPPECETIALPKIGFSLVKNPKNKYSTITRNNMKKVIHKKRSKQETQITPNMLITHNSFLTLA
jgi:hypothetical protein